MTDIPDLRISPARISPDLTLCGAGEPALLFVHGFCCSKADWDGIVPDLSADHLCATLDLPGHGDAPASGEATVEGLAHAVVAARKALGSETVILVGHSLGAKVIRDAWRLDRTGIAGMVMIDGVLYQGAGTDLVAAARRRIASEPLDVFVERQFGVMFPPGTDVRTRDLVLGRGLRMNADFVKQLYVDAVTFDPSRGRATLEALAVPTLALQSTTTDVDGRRIQLVPGMRTPFMDAVEELVPGGRAVVIPGAGHFTMFDQPRAVIDAIRSFAAEVGRGVS